MVEAALLEMLVAVELSGEFARRETWMEFFNMKTKRKVDVPESQVRKRVLEQLGSKGGVQRRYQLVAEQDGTRMFKFVNEQTFRSLNVPEIKG